MKKRLFVLFLILCPALAFARNYADGPEYRVMEMFRPVYFTTGLPLGPKPDADNCDIKFQLSLKFNLWRNMAGSKWTMFVGYSQISVWDFYKPSSPFRDNTYIPGIYNYRPVLNKAGETVGGILLGFEHRSNGLPDDRPSGSINYLFGNYSHEFRCGIMVQAELRGGFGWLREDFTASIMHKYVGYLRLGAAYSTPDKSFEAMASVTPLFAPGGANATAELCYRIGKKHQNPYVFIQYHYGYDEAVADWQLEPGQQLRHMLRFGIMITPHTFMRCNY